MQCEYRDNATGRTTATESVADAWVRDGLDVDFREVDEASWRPLTGWRPCRPSPAARHAPAAEPDPDEYVPPHPVLEIDRDTMALLGEQADLRRRDESAVAAAVAAFHAAMTGNPEPHPAETPSTTGRDRSHQSGPRFPRVPDQPQETTTMRIAVKSTGGIIESFLQVDNVEEGVKEAAKHLAEDYGLPTDIELWSDRPDAEQPRRLGGFRFVAVDGNGTVVELG